MNPAALRTALALVLLVFVVAPRPAAEAKESAPASPLFLPLYWRVAQADAVVRGRVFGDKHHVLVTHTLRGDARRAPVRIPTGRRMESVPVHVERGEELLVFLRYATYDGVRYLEPSTGAGSLGVFSLAAPTVSTFRAGLYELSTFAEEKDKVPSIPTSKLLERVKAIAKDCEEPTNLVRRFGKRLRSDHEVAASVLLACLDKREGEHVADALLPLLDASRLFDENGELARRELNHQQVFAARIAADATAAGREGLRAYWRTTLAHEEVDDLAPLHRAILDALPRDDEHQDTVLAFLRGLVELTEDRKLRRAIEKTIRRVD